jgi:hypothetical protein
VREIFEKYEPTEAKKSGHMSLVGFLVYMNDPSQFITNASDRVYHDMSHPMKDYFINSTHNT